MFAHKSRLSLLVLLLFGAGCSSPTPTKTGRPTTLPDTATPEMRSTGTPVSAPSIAAQPTANPISVTKVIDAGDHYIVIGEFIPPAGAVLSDCCGILYFDANGQGVYGESFPAEIDAGTPTANVPFASVWGLDFKKGSVALPITVNVEDLHWKPYSFTFEFDAGDHPQLGDELPINQSFNVNGAMVTLKSVHVIAAQMPSARGAYSFDFAYPNYDVTISIHSIEIEGITPVNWGGSGGGGCSACPVVTQAPGEQYNMEFSSLPKGKLRAHVTIEIVDGEQAWTMQWQP